MLHKIIRKKVVFMEHKEDKLIATPRAKPSGALVGNDICPEEYAEVSYVGAREKSIGRHGRLASHGVGLCRSFLPSKTRANARCNTSHLRGIAEIHDNKLHYTIEASMITCMVMMSFFELQNRTPRSSPRRVLIARRHWPQEGGRGARDGNGFKFALAILLLQRNVDERKVEMLMLYVSNPLISCLRVGQSCVHEFQRTNVHGNAR